MAFWIAPVAMGLLQAGYGMYQSNQAKRELERLKSQREELRPGIPEDVNRMVSRAEQRHLEGMPGRDRQEAALRRSTASSVSAVREGAMTSSQYLEGVAEAYRGELEGLDRLATQEAVFRSQAEDRVQQALSTRAGYDHQAQMLPYQEVMGDMGLARQAGQAGMQNMWDGVQTAAGGVMQAGMQKQRLNELDMIYGDGAKTASWDNQPQPGSGINTMNVPQREAPTIQTPPTVRSTPMAMDYNHHNVYDRMKPIDPRVDSKVIGVGFSLNKHTAEGFLNNIG